MDVHCLRESSVSTVNLRLALCDPREVMECLDQRYCRGSMGNMCRSGIAVVLIERFP